MDFLIVWANPDEILISRFTQPDRQLDGLLNDGLIH